MQPIQNFIYFILNSGISTSLLIQVPGDFLQFIPISCFYPFHMVNMLKKTEDHMYTCSFFLLLIIGHFCVLLNMSRIKEAKSLQVMLPTFRDSFFCSSGLFSYLVSQFLVSQKDRMRMGLSTQNGLILVKIELDLQ